MKRTLDSLDHEAAVAAWSTRSSQTNDEEWESYPCTLVTPLYGGGVKAGEVDPELPIRPSAIRGHLRFWWRVACGPLSSEAMFAREAAIWGGIGEAGPVASKVRVRVTQVSALELEAAHKYIQDPNAPEKLKSFPVLENWAEGYALFSAKGELTGDRRHIEVAPKVLAKAGTTFQLALWRSPALSPTQRDEVLTALRWWVSFGGIGARTRRGLGVLKVKELELVTAEAVAQRGGRLALRSGPTGATQAWKEAVGRLKDFRQKPGLGRNPGPNPNQPGRSRWPEADSIRASSGCADPRHATRLVAVNAFPRAAFGLPIVFHFKDAPTVRDRRQPGFDRTKFDPEDHFLEPADVSSTDKRDRLASPLIVRPYWDGTKSKWVPAALLLPGWEEHMGIDLKFKGQGYVPTSWPNDPASQAALAADVSPMAGRADDPLSAFMNYFLEP